MSRELTDYDWEILKKLAPELCADGNCSSSGRKYRSILPPISMHYAKSREDFRQRIDRLTDEELDYVLCLAENGEESLTCIRPEHKEQFLEMVDKRTSPERAMKLRKFVDFLENMG
jgi:PHD/YefM family antitoxin component YafN of YafNO toxin-antitoxin module